MRRNLFLILTLFFFVSTFTGCDSGPKITPLPADAVILAFGDSLTHGTGAADGQSYPEVLAELLGRQVINEGIPGEVSARGLKRLPEVLDEYAPDLVILCHGGNDFLRHMDQDRILSNLKSMIGLIKAHGAEVILVGVPKLGFGIQVPEFYAKLAEEQAIPFEGDILVDLLSDNNMKSDTIHPNAIGYRLMAEAIYQVINQAQQK